MKSRKLIEWLLIIYGVGAFILNSVLRSSLIEAIPFHLPSDLTVPNWIVIASVIIIVVDYIRNRETGFRYFKWFLFPLLILYIVLVSISNSHSLYSIAGDVLWKSILPGMLLIFLSFPKINGGKVFFYFLLTLNTVLLITFSLGILDYFIGGKINMIIADYFSSPEWANMIQTQQNVYGFRMITLFGAPLMNAYLALIMLVLNVIFEKKYHHGLMNRFLVYLITVITIFLTGSRTALILSFVFILYSEFYEKMGVAKFLVMIVILIGLTYTPIFQNTIGTRLNGDTLFANDARFKMIDLVQGGRLGEFNFWTGNGYNYSRVLTSTALNDASANFEFPVFMFAYDYGLLSTIIYYIFYVGIPVIYLIRSRSLYLTVSYLVTFIYLQTCNMTAVYYDFNLMAAFVATLFMIVSDNDSYKKLGRNNI